jgi:5'-3' exonuclease
VIDDFVLLCFFAGNDFLPHLPALNIRNGGIEILLHLYKRLLPSLGGYLSHNGEVELARLELFLREFSFGEEEILKELENNKIQMVSLKY